MGHTVTDGPLEKTRGEQKQFWAGNVFMWIIVRRNFFHSLQEMF